MGLELGARTTGMRSSCTANRRHPMGSGGDRAQTASNRIPRSRLLLSAALAALALAAPAGDPTSAQAMSLGSGFGAVRFNSGPRTSVGPSGNLGHSAIGHTTMGNGRVIGV